MLPELGSISRRRKTIGLTQRELANRAGCSQSYLAKVERARAVPNYNLAGEIFLALETAERRGEKTVGGVMHTSVKSFDVSDTVADAAKVAKDKGFSQFPILRRGKPVGCVTTRQMLGVDASLQLGRIMGPALPSVNPATSVSAVRPLLRQDQPAILVIEGGEIAGIVTAEDLL